MAKALSQVYTIIRGSVGGVTYLSGRNNAIVVRARTAPVQPNTTPQVQMRNAWAAAEATWRLATDIQRNQWGLYADLVVYQGPVGTYTLTGRQRFLATLSLADYLNTRFGTTITISAGVPTTPGWFLISGVKLNAPASSGTGFELVVNNHEIVAAELLINVSQPLPATRNFWKGPWDNTHTQNAVAAASSSSVRDITGLIAGEKYFIRVRAIGDLLDHRISEEWIISGVAQTTI